MSRDLSFGGVQQNIAYYSFESLILLVGGFLLISYLLIENEFSNLFKSSIEVENSKYSVFLNMYLWIVTFGILSIFEKWLIFGILDIICTLERFLTWIILRPICRIFVQRSLFFIICHVDVPSFIFLGTFT